MANIYLQDTVAARLKRVAAREKRNPSQQLSIALDILEEKKQKEVEKKQ